MDHSDTMSSKPRQMQPLNILHLEDDPFIAELTQLELQRNNIPCHWVTADSGQAFLAALDREHFDLILSDMSVPGIDGQHALQVAKSKCPDVPFVFVSGSDDATMIHRCLDEGAAEFINKDQLWRLVPTLRSLRKFS
jgi:CheY-like chemotaxis protein